MSQFYYPDITAAAFRIKETVELLAAMGHTVHVIAARPHKAVIDGTRVDDGNIHVTRAPIISYVGGGKWNYIIHYISFMLSSVWASWKHPSKFDIVWASSPPLFVGVAGWAVSRLKKAKFVLDVRDIWPDSAATTGQIRAGSPMFRIAKQVEKWLYRVADRITCVAQPMAEYISSYNIERPAVIYNAIPGHYLDAVEAAEKNSAGSHAGEPLTVAYVGNMGYCQNLGLVIDAAEKLQDAHEQRVRFLLVGEGAEKTKLEARVRDAGLRNVEIQGAVPKAEALRISIASSALVLLLKNDGTMDKTIPSKVFDYLATGRPILFGLQGEARSILASTGGNIEFDAESSDSLVAAVRRFIETCNALAPLAAGHRELVRKRFRRESMTKELDRVFGNLLNDCR